MVSNKEAEQRVIRLKERYKAMQDANRVKEAPFDIDVCHPTVGQPTDQICFACFEFINEPMFNHYQKDCFSNDFDIEDRKALNAYSHNFGDVGHRIILEHLTGVNVQATSVTTPPEKIQSISKSVQCSILSTTKSVQTDSNLSIDLSDLRRPVTTGEYEAVNELIELLRDRGYTINGEYQNPVATTSRINTSGIDDFGQENQVDHLMHTVIDRLIPFDDYMDYDVPIDNAFASGSHEQLVTQDNAVPSRFAPDHIPSFDSQPLSYGELNVAFIDQNTCESIPNEIKEEPQSQALTEQVEEINQESTDDTKLNLATNIPRKYQLVTVNDAKFEGGEAVHPEYLKRPDLTMIFDFSKDQRSDFEHKYNCNIELANPTNHLQLYKKLRLDAHPIFQDYLKSALADKDNKNRTPDQYCSYLRKAFAAIMRCNERHGQTLTIDVVLTAEQAIVHLFQIMKECKMTASTMSWYQKSLINFLAYIDSNLPIDILLGRRKLLLDRLVSRLNKIGRNIKKQGKSEKFYMKPKLEYGTPYSVVVSIFRDPAIKQTLGEIRAYFSLNNTITEWDLTFLNGYLANVFIHLNSQRNECFYKLLVKDFYPEEDRIIKIELEGENGNTQPYWVIRYKCPKEQLQGNGSYAGYNGYIVVEKETKELLEFYAEVMTKLFGLDVNKDSERTFFRRPCGADVGNNDYYNRHFFKIISDHNWNINCNNTRHNLATLGYDGYCKRLFRDALRSDEALLAGHSIDTRSQDYVSLLAKCRAVAIAFCRLRQLADEDSLDHIEELTGLASLISIKRPMESVELKNKNIRGVKQAIINRKRLLSNDTELSVKRGTVLSQTDFVSDPQVSSSTEENDCFLEYYTNYLPTPTEVKSEDLNNNEVDSIDKQDAILEVGEETRSYHRIEASLDYDCRIILVRILNPITYEVTKKELVEEVPVPSDISATEENVVEPSKANLVETNVARRSERITKEQQLLEAQRGLFESLAGDMNEKYVEMYKTGNMGDGVMTKRSFKKNEYVLEYKGELLTRREALLREAEYKKDPKIGCYQFFFPFLGKKLCVDATAPSCYLGRKINHSHRKPNLRVEVINYHGEPRVIFVPKKDLPSGTILNFDYGDRSKTAIANNKWLKDS